MDMQKLQARAHFERMIYNYAGLGTIDDETATDIISYIGFKIGGGEPPRREGNIIYFPVRGERPEPEKENIPWYTHEEYGEIFRSFGMGECKNIYVKLYYAFYDLHIGSLEELAKTLPSKFIRRHGVGIKCIEAIRDLLVSKGITSKEWEPWIKKV